MDVAALSQSLSTQSIMGQLIVQVLDQTLELSQQQALSALDQNMRNMQVAIEGLGENLDVVA
jgi:hypothetical protein